MGPNGNPPSLQDKHTKDLSSNAQRVLLAAKPFVRVKSISHWFSLPRILVTMVLLLTVTVGAALVGELIVTHIVRGAPNVTGLTVPPNVDHDNLKNNGDWPTGGKFFFADTHKHIPNNPSHTTTPPP